MRKWAEAWRSRNELYDRLLLRGTVQLTNKRPMENRDIPRSTVRVLCEKHMHGYTYSMPCFLRNHMPYPLPPTITIPITTIAQENRFFLLFKPSQTERTKELRRKMTFTIYTMHTYLFTIEMNSPVGLSCAYKLSNFTMDASDAREFYSPR
ncbi:hypothetical protein CBL_09166 [Carabus blaptoides fortunei]